MARIESLSGRGSTAKESNNFKQGKSGSKCKVKPGIIGGPHQNPRSGGGINRATRGAGQD